MLNVPLLGWKCYIHHNFLSLKLFVWSFLVFCFLAICKVAYLPSLCTVHTFEGWVGSMKFFPLNWFLTFVQNPGIERQIFVCFLFIKKELYNYPSLLPILFDSASSKTFEQAQKPNLTNGNHLLVWHKMFETGTKYINFLVWPKKLGPVHNILGPGEGRGNSLGHLIR